MQAKVKNENLTLKKPEVAKAEQFKNQQGKDKAAQSQKLKNGAKSNKKFGGAKKVDLTAKHSKEVPVASKK